jgi:hypothetical protein
VAAIAPLVGGILWLVPAAARAGRAVAAIGWVALVYAVTGSLYVLGQVVASAAVPNAGFAAPHWSAGPGLWCGIVGIGFGIATLVLSILASRRAAENSLLVPDDDGLAQSRAFGAVVAAVLTAVTLGALALPVYRTATAAGPTLLVGFQVDAWGVLALAVAMISAAWAGGRAFAVSEALAYPLTGAAILCVRLAVPPAISAREGFAASAGLYAGYAAAIAFVVAAPVLARSVGRITMTDLSATHLSAGNSSAADMSARPTRTIGRGPVKRRSRKGRK